MDESTEEDGGRADVASVGGAFEFVANSRTRLRLVEELLSEEEATRRDLRDRVDAARTTVARNLEALADRGWVEHAGRTYELTAYGDVAGEALVDAAERIRVARHLQPVLEHTSRDALDVDLARLADAEVVTARPGNPWAMVNRHVSRLRETDEGSLLLPVAGLQAAEAVRDRVREGATFDVVATPSVAETMRSDPEFAAVDEELRALEGHTMTVHDGDVPFYLGVLDDAVQVGVDEAGEPRAILESDDPAVREWALETFRSYRRAAEPRAE
jgi:predicted transcriptional regulator